MSYLSRTYPNGTVIIELYINNRTVVLRAMSQDEAQKKIAECEKIIKVFKNNTDR